MSTLLLLTVLSPAAAAPDVVGADSLGMGSTSVAADRSNAAITTNPGLLALNPRYDFSAQVGIGPGLHWAVSGMDARTADDFALGFAYSGDRFEPELSVDELPGWSTPGAVIPNMKRSHHFAAGGSYAFAEDRVALGVGGHVSLYNHDRNGRGTTGNLDAGLGIKPVSELTVGLAGNNLLPFDPLSDRPMRLAGGLRLDGAPAALEVDGGWIDADEGAPVFVDAGTELRPGPVRVRGGGRYHGPSATPSVTAGLGVEGEGGAIEYGVDIPVGGAGGPAAHVIGVRFGAPAPIDIPD